MEKREINTTHLRITAWVVLALCTAAAVFSVMLRYDEIIKQPDEYIPAESHNAVISENKPDVSLEKYDGTVIFDPIIDGDGVNDVPTVKEFLRNALEPIGSCLYVYGGGWNEEDTGAGIEAVTVGVSPAWADFFDSNDGSYNHKNALYRIHDGLDCTGYVGYAAYQVFGDRYSDKGYVFASGKVGEEFLSLFGGEIIQNKEIERYRAGDIMVKDGHVWLVIGECADKSVLFAHASPPCLTLSGTCTPDGNKYSEALALAEKYMRLIAPEAYSRYPSNCSRGMSYLTEYDMYRFPENVLWDPDGLRSMNADEIMEKLVSDEE